MVLRTSMSYPFLLKSFTAGHKYFSFSKKCIIKLKTQTTDTQEDINKEFSPTFCYIFDIHAFNFSVQNVMETYSC